MLGREIVAWHWGCISHAETFYYCCYHHHHLAIGFYLEAKRDTVEMSALLHGQRQNTLDSLYFGQRLFVGMNTSFPAYEEVLVTLERRPWNLVTHKRLPGIKLVACGFLEWHFWASLPSTSTHTNSRFKRQTLFIQRTEAQTPALFSRYPGKMGMVSYEMWSFLSKGADFPTIWAQQGIPNLQPIPHPREIGKENNGLHRDTLGVSPTFHHLYHRG